MLLNLLKRIHMSGYLIVFFLAIFTGLSISHKIKINNLEEQRDTAREVATQMGFSLDSAQAIQDTTRLIQEDTTSRIWERRVLQLEDSLVAVHGELTATIESIRIDTNIVTQTVDSMLVVPIDVYRIPVRVFGEISVASLGGASNVKIDVSIDPIMVGLDITCNEPVNLIRSANVRASTASWVSLQFDRIQQTRDVCNSQPIWIPDPPATSPWYKQAAVGTLIGMTTAFLFSDDNTWEDLLIGSGLGLGFVVLSYAL